MESKHKNALIGALLAVVFVMAVGYAAFAQQLTINGTAEITSTWDIHFLNSEVSQASGITVTCHNGLGGGSTCGTNSTDATNPSMTVTRDSNTEMTFKAYLLQPGDYVTATVHPHNYGSLCAHGTMSVTSTAAGGYSAGTVADGETTGSKTVTLDHIRFTFTPTFANSLAADASDDIEVKAEYLTNTTTNETLPATKLAATVKLDYSQVACN